MKHNFTQFFTFFIASFLTLQGIAQTEVCNGVFEEENGLLVIEMESGVLPANSDWQLDSEPDPDQPGSTIDYLFWNGTESFNNLSNAIITYNIKINTPGTYRLLVRGRIGLGDERDRHNDFWLNIDADDFFAERRSSGQVISILGAPPECDANPDRGCADRARDEDGYIKIFMNVTPTNGDGVERNWRFVSNANNTTDGDDVTRGAHLLIKATFNEVGNYAINIDARSSFYFMDRMVLFRDGILSSAAQDLNNPVSTCNEDALSINSQDNNSLKIFPNPATNTIELSNLSTGNQGKFVIRNILGATVRELNVTASKQSIDVSALKSGVYFISKLDATTSFTKKFIKL